MGNSDFLSMNDIFVMETLSVKGSRLIRWELNSSIQNTRIFGRLIISFNKTNCEHIQFNKLK